MNGRRILGAVLIGGAIVIASGAPALATIRETGIHCSGNAVITDGTKTYNINAANATATIPYSGKAAWQGSVAPATHDHSGEVFVDLGFIDAVVGEWASPNEKSESARSGVKEYDLPSWVPPFQLRIGGSHTGKEGSCSGEVLVNLDGDWKTDPAALIVLAATAATGIVMVRVGWVR